MEAAPTVCLAQAPEARYDMVSQPLGGIDQTCWRYM
jgi:hypothetical protein